MLDVGSRFGYLVFACGIFPLLVLPALAQNQQDIDLEEIELTVTEKLLRRPVTSTQRRDATLQDGTRPAYTIERQEIEQQGARTAKEALKFLPGILGGGTVGTEFNALSGQFIRGSNTAQVLILLDGRPVNNLGAGALTYQKFPPVSLNG